LSAIQPDIISEKTISEYEGIDHYDHENQEIKQFIASLQHIDRH
jgi:hypothetical protein